MLVFKLLSVLVFTLFSRNVMGTLTCCQTANDEEMNIVIQLLLAEGYTVEEGQMVFLNQSQINQIPFPNANSLYATFQFPSVFNQPSSFPMGGSDAILFHGCTPPLMVYFGFRSYYVARINSQDLKTKKVSYTLLGSDMGDTVNSLEIKTSRGWYAPFDSFTTYIATGDEKTFFDINEAFAITKLRKTVNLDIIPSELFNFDWSANILQTPRDTFGVALRTVLIEGDTTDYVEYTQRPQKVYLVRSSQTALGHLQPRIPLPLVLRNATTGLSEKFAIGGCLDDLTNSIQTMMLERGFGLMAEYNFASAPGTVLKNPLLTEYIFNWGIWCIENQKYCAFSNRDTLYSWVAQAFVLTDPTVYFVIGVDHNDLDKTIYNSVTTYYVVDPVVKTDIYTTIQSLSNFDYDRFDFTTVVPSGVCPDAVRLNMFVIQVSRPSQHIEGLASMCINETQLSPTQPFVFFSRAHLNPNTATHPDPNEVILPRLLSFHMVDL